MSSVRRAMWLELVAGVEKCRNLPVSEEMWHVPGDTDAGSRNHEGIGNAGRLHILAKFAHR